MKSVDFKIWAVVSALLCAYGAVTLAEVASAMAFSQTQQARVLTCSVRPGSTGGYPVGPSSKELIATGVAEYGEPGRRRLVHFEFSSPAEAAFKCSDLPSVQIRTSPLSASSVYLKGPGTSEAWAEGSMALILGMSFVIGLRQRYLQSSA